MSTTTSTIGAKRPATIKGRPLVQAPRPALPIQCPPGLEYLALIDQIIVQQQVELLEALVGFETGNKYIARNSQGQFVYFLVEDSGFCARCCCPANRCFEMHVLDIQSTEVMKFIRPLRCTSCPCWCCCLQQVEVQAPPGNTIGFVIEDWTLCCPAYSICDRTAKPVIRVQGPFCTQSCVFCCDVKFKIVTLKGNEIGVISKQWSGLIKEAFTDADNFGVSFPVDLDVHVKACLIACTVLIDYMFFEQTPQDKE